MSKTEKIRGIKARLIKALTHVQTAQMEAGKYFVQLRDLGQSVDVTWEECVRDRFPITKCLCRVLARLADGSLGDEKTARLAMSKLRMSDLQYMTKETIHGIVHGTHKIRSYKAEGFVDKPFELMDKKEARQNSNPKGMNARDAETYREPQIRAYGARKFRVDANNGDIIFISAGYEEMHMRVAPSLLQRAVDAVAAGREQAKTVKRAKARSRRQTKRPRRRKKVA